MTPSRNTPLSYVSDSGVGSAAATGLPASEKLSVTSATAVANAPPSLKSWLGIPFEVSAQSLPSARITTLAVKSMLRPMSVTLAA